ncbi:low-affinity glucose transporter hxt3 [Colletotrichum higginsianum]|nr:low-affinity glucose transporter hxt3 [Colletotrichum higginsianum]
MVEIELESVSKTIEMERRHSSSTSYWAMFTAPDDLRTARRTWSAIFVQFATQAMVGSGFVSGYGIQIFETGGWSPDLAALLAGLAIVTQAVFGMPGAIFSDKLGRRKAMIGGAAVGAVILALIGMCGYFVDKHSESNPALAKSYGSATVALVFLWCAVFGATWLWCPFVYPSEIFPAQSRAKGSSVGIVGLGLGSFFASMISPYLFDAIGYQSLFMICGLSFLVAMICFLWMPETAGKTLEEIDGLYD